MDAKTQSGGGTRHQPTNQAAMAESWRGAPANQPPGCRELNAENSTKTRAEPKKTFLFQLRQLTSFPDTAVFHWIYVSFTLHMCYILCASFLAANCKFDWFFLVGSAYNLQGDSFPSDFTSFNV